MLSALFSHLVLSTASPVPFEYCDERGFLVQRGKTIFPVSLGDGSVGTGKDIPNMRNLNACGYDAFNGFLVCNDSRMFTWVGHADASRTEFKAQSTKFRNNSRGIASITGDVFQDGGEPSEPGWWYTIRMERGAEIHNCVRLDSYLSAEPELLEMVSTGLPFRGQDVAFHPKSIDKRQAVWFSLQNSGKLYKGTVDFDNLNVHVEEVGEVAGVPRSAFGAQFFDAEGFFYVSDNDSGMIYAMSIDDIDNPVLTVDHTINGPADTKNDGVRCSFANVGAEVWDFGDAPDSYGTKLEDDGPRHSQSPNKWLFIGGTKPDFEQLAQNNDEYDEASMTVPIFHQGERQLLNLPVSGGDGGGFFSMWIDWDRNGTFEPHEKVIDNSPVAPHGVRVIEEIQVPFSDIIHGATWSRMRISAGPVHSHLGAAPDGEVEDQLVEVRTTTTTSTAVPRNLPVPDLTCSGHAWALQGDSVQKFDTSSNSFVDMPMNIDGMSFGAVFNAVGHDYQNGYLVGSMDGGFAFVGYADETKTSLTVNKTDYFYFDEHFGVAGDVFQPAGSENPGFWYSVGQNQHEEASHAIVSLQDYTTSKPVLVEVWLEDAPEDLEIGDLCFHPASTDATAAVWFSVSGKVLYRGIVNFDDESIVVEEVGELEIEDADEAVWSACWFARDGHMFISNSVDGNVSVLDVTDMENPSLEVIGTFEGPIVDDAASSNCINAVTTTPPTPTTTEVDTTTVTAPAPETTEPVTTTLPTPTTTEVDTTTVTAPAPETTVAVTTTLPTPTTRTVVDSSTKSCTRCTCSLAGMRGGPDLVITR